jgi:hypothetical protein
MTDKATTPARKRRNVSKARLYKELLAFMAEQGIDPSDSIVEVLDNLKEEIVNEAIK